MSWGEFTIKGKETELMAKHNNGRGMDKEQNALVCTKHSHHNAALLCILSEKQ